MLTRSAALNVLDTWVKSLENLLIYADTLVVDDWPPRYPLDTDWLYSIFTAYMRITKTATREAFEEPTVVAFFKDMHEEFVSDWRPEILEFHDRISVMGMDVLAERTPRARVPLFVHSSESLPSPTSDESRKVNRDPSRRRVTIALDDDRSEEHYSEPDDQYPNERTSISGEVDGDYTMDTAELLHSLPVLAPSRPTPSGETLRPPFYGRQNGGLPISPSEKSSMHGKLAAVGAAHPSSRSTSSSQQSREYRQSNRDGTEMRMLDDELYEREVRNREALMNSREETLRLREEMVSMKESHAKDLLRFSQLAVQGSGSSDEGSSPLRSSRSSKKEVARHSKSLKTKSSRESSSEDSHVHAPSASKAKNAGKTSKSTSKPSKSSSNSSKSSKNKRDATPPPSDSSSSSDSDSNADDGNSSRGSDDCSSSSSSDHKPLVKVHVKSKLPTFIAGDKKKKVPDAYSLVYGGNGHLTEPVNFPLSLCLKPSTTWGGLMPMIS